MSLGRIKDPDWKRTTSRRHAIFCSICGATVSTIRLAEAEQVTALCVACRETMRRLNIARERSSDDTQT